LYKTQKQDSRRARGEVGDSWFQRAKRDWDSGGGLLFSLVLISETEIVQERGEKSKSCLNGLPGILPANYKNHCGVMPGGRRSMVQEKENRGVSGMGE